jgi:hypothetical protein
VDDGEKTFNAFKLERGPRRRSGHLFVINPEGRVEFVHGPSSAGIEYVRRKLEPESP